MKTIDKIAILCILTFAAAACNPSVEPTPVPEPDVVKPETRTLTFVLPELVLEEGEDAPAAFKTAWVPGDQIVVHGEYAKNQVTVTLGAGDISADGKSATLTVENLYPYRREDCGSTLYASYPAAMADNLKHCFFYSKFSTTNAELMAACNNGDTFQFQRICGVLSMTVQGDYEGYLLSTPKKEALGFGFLQVKLTDKEQLFSQYKGDPLAQVEGPVDGSRILLYMPDGTSLSAGFTVKLKENGDYTKIFKYGEPVVISRGGLVDIGDITDGLQRYDNPFSDDIKDLDAEGNANCYVITEPGGYKFKAVKGNDPVQFLAEPAEAKVLWETWNDDSEVTPGSVLASASYAEDYVILRTPDTLHPGNAVVAVMDENGVILWSWHIWIPETAIQTGSYGGIMGADLMDRNLGALVATEATDSQIDVRSYGMVYQWGRKDPFTAAGSFNSSTRATYAGEPEEVAALQISLAESIANPRLLGHVNNGDWATVPQNDFWTELQKTIYDPCPPGYRVPNRTGDFWSSDLTTQAGWGVNLTAGWLKLGNPAAVFPIAGYRDDYSVGGMAKVGVRTLYWFARANDDAKGAGADLRSDKSYTFGSAPKARLGSVRCVKE
ncbi:MAG: hypothetical protein K6F25_09905 [Bacteroidales bacterium]|nr:hypothetical protein [Bacteroidales bacterium]